MTATDPLPRSKIQFFLFSFPHQIKIVPNRVTHVLQGSFWKVGEGQGETTNLWKTPTGPLDWI